MNQQTLLKFSLIISLIGILTLLFLANFLKPRLTNVGDINEKMLNRKVRVQGEVFNFRDKETFQILSISDETGKIDVLCECKATGKIEVTGTVQEYGEYLQIQANKITKI